MNPYIEFRHCHRADFPACARISADAFPFLRRLSNGEFFAMAMATAMVEMCYTASTYRQLAIVDGEVVGFIYGQVKRNFTLIDIFRLVKQQIVILVRFILGRYGSRRKLIRHLKLSLHDIKEVRRHMPSGEAEAMLFAVCPRYQGKGIGRALMDSFVRHALGCGVRVLSLATDEISSFWFYERYGFEKWADFKGWMASDIMKRPIKSFTYRLLLRKAKRTAGQDAGIFSSSRDRVGNI